MQVSRRTLLTGVLGLSVVPIVGFSPQIRLGPVPGDPFTLVVASGEPTPDGVVLWTRLAPGPLADDGLGGMGARPVDVDWEVAADENFTRVVQRGTVSATTESAHAVHVVPGGLQPGGEYFYRFRSNGYLSPAGRTRTWADDTPEHPEPGFPDRRAAALQAYYENMPLCASATPRGPDMQLYRRVDWGSLATFHMLDTRQYRTDQACGDEYRSDCPERFDLLRTLTGPAQEQWLLWLSAVPSAVGPHRSAGVLLPGRSGSRPGPGASTSTRGTAMSPSATASSRGCGIPRSATPWS